MPSAVRIAIALIFTGMVLGLMGLIATASVVDEIIAVDPQAQVAPEAYKAGFYFAKGGIFVVSTAISIVLAIFIAKGANWARVTYATLTGLGAVMMLFNFLFRPAPALLQSATALQTTLAIVVTALLFSRAATRYFEPVR